MRRLLFLFAVAVTVSIGSLGAAPVRASNTAVTYIGLYDRAHFGTVLKGDMPFDDSIDAPGPGRVLSSPNGGILPIGKLEGARFTSIGSPDETLGEVAYASHLRDCYAKADPSARISCALGVASGGMGFAEPRLAMTTWYCNGLALPHLGASASFNDSENAEASAAGLEYAVGPANCPRPAGTTVTTPLVVSSDKSARSIPFDMIYGKYDPAHMETLAARVWPVVRPEWQQRVGRQLASRRITRTCEDLGVVAPAAISRLEATLAPGATWADYVATGGLQYWYEANLGDGRTLLFVDLSAPIEGVPRTTCPWRAHAQLWLIGDGSTYTVATPPRTGVILPMTLIVIAERRYIVSTAAPSDIAPHAYEGDPKPELTLDRWDGNRIIRIGYPGLKPLANKDGRYPLDVGPL